MSRRRQRLRQHTNPFSYQGHYTGPSPAELLDGAPTELEIGPGFGELLVARALDAPRARILGVEVRAAYVEICNRALDEAEIANARVIYAEAHRDVPELIGDGTLEIIYLMFPDPWFKKRHHKRRVLTLDFAGVLVRKLRPRGEIHYATDNAELHEDMGLHLDAADQLQRIAGVPPAAQASGRGIHHAKRGDPIYGAIYRRG